MRSLRAATPLAPFVLAILAPSAAGQSLTADVQEIDVQGGGQQTFSLDAGGGLAGNLYFLGGTLSGTAPGLVVGGAAIPLNPDAYFGYTLNNPNTPPLTASFATLDGAGQATALFTLPSGSSPALSGMHADHAFVVIDPFAAILHVSNPVGLDFVTCGTSGPSFVSVTASGSAATTPFYATAMAVTVNDPSPKLVGPGNPFTPAVQDKVMLAPLSDPMNATDLYSWSGGDEVGYYRDRLALDGSTPGVDRIFFVARNTTETPNFVDWDGAAFSNETSLAPALGSIQRLTVTEEGDLIGNDFFGRFYLWDKQAGYAQTPLFQIQNTPGSVPWGASLDTNLGKIAWDPVSQLILMPVNNSLVSTSGQLYGFDLAGNRIFVDQDLLGATPSGFNSFRFGATVDLTDPTCRVLVHAGRDGGEMYFVRFSGGLSSKTVNVNGGADDQGGWIGVLTGGEIWTNTNTFTYGVVRRTLPLDW